MVFFLGTHQPHWLTRTALPLCVSRARLQGRKTLPRAQGPVFLDGGGFTELERFGGWRVGAAMYAAEMERYVQEIGSVVAVAVQDWMCEPFMVARTGLSVAEHQARTVTSYLDLRRLAPALPWLPVLQGWERTDYLRHVEQYATAGVDLTALPLVGVGSVCRRQHTGMAVGLVREFAAAGLRLHGFGVKLRGLEEMREALVSADSMAWSFAARREPALPGCVGHRNCANCLRYALRWQARVTALLAAPRAQLELAL